MTTENPTIKTQNERSIVAELQRSNSDTLKDKLHRIFEAVGESQVEQEVTVSVHYDDGRLTSVTIEPQEDWTNSGELGMDSFHIILGVRGGLKTASKYSPTSSKEVNDFGNLIRRIESSA